MISDIDILSVLKNRTDYERFIPFVQDNLLTKEGTIICKYLKGYYSTGAFDDLDWLKFASFFFLKHPTMDATNRKVYKHIFDSLDSYETEDDDQHNLVMGELVRKTYATKIADQCMRIADGTSDEPLASIEVLLDSANGEANNYTNEDTKEVKFEFKDLFDYSDDPPLQFSLSELRECCSGLQKGDFAIVGAHPDTGKTAFLIDELVHMCTQLPEGKVAVYFNNEQKGRAINQRIISRVISKATNDILLDPVDSLAEYKAQEASKRIVVIDQADNDRMIIDRLKRLGDTVGLILFDQLWKVKLLGLKSSNEFMALGKQFQWGRELAKTYAPVMTVHQLDGASEGMKYIGMHNMFGSKVALQGEADLIVNIGRVTDGSTPQNLRHFYVPKNKICGPNPSKTNNRFDAYINHDHCKYEDIL